MSVQTGTNMTDIYAHCRNEARSTHASEERAAECARNLSDWSGAVEEIHSWPEYAPQPLHALDRTARSLDIAKLFYKDESQRFGRELGSFKALGAPYTE
jgi:diaminopropionate ammonia-lyase